jgi:hypothetical protein
MKKNLSFLKIIRKIVIVKIVLVLFLFGIFASDISFAQNKYRRPSESDIEWLFGNNNKQTSQNENTNSTENNANENLNENKNTINSSIFTTQSQTQIQVQPQSDLTELGNDIFGVSNEVDLKSQSCQCEYCIEECKIEPCDKTCDKPNTNPNPNPNPQKTEQINIAENTKKTESTESTEIVENTEKAKNAESKEIAEVAEGEENNVGKKNDVEQKKLDRIFTTVSVFPPKATTTNSTLNNKNNNEENKPANLEADPQHSTTQNKNDPFWSQNDVIFKSSKNVDGNNYLPDDYEQQFINNDSDESFAESCIGVLSWQVDRFRRYARVKHSTQHNEQCNCLHCSNLDNPDMTGNGIWNFHRVVSFGNNMIIGNFRTSPNIFLSRMDIATRFNVEAQNRVWFDYRQFNNAAESAIILLPNGNIIAAQKQSIDMFTFGIEKRIGTNFSLEVRIPLLYQFDSQFADIRNLQSSKTELGNITLVSKYVFARTKQVTLSAGLGILLPTAADLETTDFNVNALIENKTCNIAPYLAAQWHPNKNTFGQLFFQTDIPISKNEIRLGNKKSKIAESQTVQFGLQVGRWFYRNECGDYSSRIGGFIEIDYATTTNSADNIFLYNNNSFVGVNSTTNQHDNLNFTAGMPITFGQLTVNNAIIVPLLNDSQFSIAYNFSLCRKF